ncbi:MAG: hypothetical protein LBS86_07490, partial [Treponema sp.]|nr:hypothetical protein [Treponema sp.]
SHICSGQGALSPAFVEPVAVLQQAVTELVEVHQAPDEGAAPTGHIVKQVASTGSATGWVETHRRSAVPEPVEGTNVGRLVRQVASTRGY